MHRQLKGGKIKLARPVFGEGAIEGVAGPETANNAYPNAALIPLFTLGMPGSPTTAILMGAFMINGLVPGPSLFVYHAPFVWPVIASLVVGNAILLILNLPFTPVRVAVLKIPYTILITIVLGFSVIGVYSLRNDVFDIGVMLGFGILGYLFKKVDIPAAPLILTLVLGPLMEQRLRQTLESRGRVRYPVLAAAVGDAARDRGDGDRDLDVPHTQQAQGRRQRNLSRHP